MVLKQQLQKKKERKKNIETLIYTSQKKDKKQTNIQLWGI